VVFYTVSFDRYATGAFQVYSRNHRDNEAQGAIYSKNNKWNTLPL